MPLVAPNEGLLELIQVLFSSATVPSPAWELLLWTNDYVPTAATVYADLTEATFSGYSRETIARGTWGAPVLVGNEAHIQYGTVPIEWTSTGPFPIVYGYAIVRSSPNKALIVERFAAPVDLSTFATLGVLPRCFLRTAA